MRRRLTALLARIYYRIRLKTQEQHITDLEGMLSDMVTARDGCMTEINILTQRLLAAHDQRDALAKRSGLFAGEAQS